MMEWFVVEDCQCAPTAPPLTGSNCSSIGDDPIIRGLPLKLNPLLRVCAANACWQSVGDGVRAFGHRIERLFKRAARLFETLLACLERHTDRVTNNSYAAAEGKIDG